MDPVTHVATGLAISQLIPTPSRTWAALAGAVFAILPDLDYLAAINDRLAYLWHHRGFTHSLVAIPLFALLAAALGRALGGPKWLKPLFILGVAVLGSHLLLDLATSYGTQILSPFTRAKYTLDWLFIIDPYLTVLMLAAAAGLLWPGGRGRFPGIVCLTLAGAYFLLCGLFHHQALNLARQVWQTDDMTSVTVAALPQPFSPRRWHLAAFSPGEARQAFVELPYWPFGRFTPKVREIQIVPHRQVGLQAPPSPYFPPTDIETYHWRSASPSPTRLSPEARRILDIYLDFARFPLLAVREQVGGDLVFTWLDLRFSMPGRALPFVLHLRLDPTGRLAHWGLGVGRPPSAKGPEPPPRPG